MKTTTWLILGAFLFALVSSAAPPDVSNVRAAQRTGTHLIDIYYNLSATGPCKVYVGVSDDAGATFKVPVFTMTGAVGPGVSPGVNRLITWNAGIDWPGRFTDQCRVRVTADDGTAPPAPAGMAFIPAGAFQMGDTFAEGSLNELPVRTVHVSAFFIDRYEVTRELWAEVYQWGSTRGYSLTSGGSFGIGHPVHSVSLDEAIKWCNARSEKEGLTPCYYTDPSQTIVHRAGNLTLTNACVKWSANGYRLPTEAEWEKAARGGLHGKRFPWGDTIAHAQANYFSSPERAYDVSAAQGYHPVYGEGTSPAGSFAPNGYGLYDMAGNVVEWVWDRLAYYDTAAIQEDPRGPATDLTWDRVLRGGAWWGNATGARCAHRYSFFISGYFVNYAGFRCVRKF